MEQKPLPPKVSDIEGPIIRVGGPVDRACVSLRFFGDLLVPEELTQLLGCQPTEAKRKGDVIPDKRYHRVANTGSWLLEGAQPETTDIEEQVSRLLATVTSDLQIWRHLTAQFAADIFCGVFLDESNWSSPEFTDTSKKSHTRRGGVSWRNGERTVRSLSRKRSN